MRYAVPDRLRRPHHRAWAAACAARRFSVRSAFGDRRRHFYARASIIGASDLRALRWGPGWRERGHALLRASAAIAVCLRSAGGRYYHWSLPKSDYHDEPQTTARSADKSRSRDTTMNQKKLNLHSDHQRNGRSDRSGGDHRGEQAYFSCRRATPPSAAFPASASCCPTSSPFPCRPSR
ncbi:MAG: hypothetical protein ACLU3I_06055 [Acutalibacteraceae bacterium]